MALSDQWLCEASATELSAALDSGETTSEDIVRALCERIARLDAPGTEVELRSVLALSGDAQSAARLADEERTSGHVRSRLHGIPVLVKDNIEVMGHPATAGSTSLLGRAVRDDAPLVARLRDAGLVILGATGRWVGGPILTLSERSRSHRAHLDRR